MSYLLEVLPEAKEGKKIRRIGWPKGKHLRAITPEQATIRLDGNTVDIKSSDCFLLVDPKRRIEGSKNWAGGNVLGYSPNSDEQIVCDWEVIQEDEKSEA